MLGKRYKRTYILLIPLLLFVFSSDAQTDTASSRGYYKFTFDLNGRYIVKHPPGQYNVEKGIVIVKITVDSTGKVIRAFPEVSGTPVESNVLQARARQVALQTHFNRSADSKEQTGTITIGLGSMPEQ